uniref:ATP synthase complex subunit 8 n=1 Tax=Palaeoagraecia brunnea TaxID=2981282 RepID=A0A977WKX9_9ORTH|nr:ATP synthase F0 subunit 8 [Palaeoagraecia brunnea]UXL83021.1 ATP synthase F0 subunit 8 [Palaeoagraecia brunnea]
MAPMSWLALFLLFSLALFLFTIFNYPLMPLADTSSNKNSNDKLLSPPLNWKW